MCITNFIVATLTTMNINKFQNNHLFFLITVKRRFFAKINKNIGK